MNFGEQGSKLHQSFSYKPRMWNMFKVNNEDTWTISDLVLVFLLLTLNM